jgi:hypothetical protein
MMNLIGANIPVANSYAYPKQEMCAFLESQLLIEMLNQEWRVNLSALRKALVLDRFPEPTQVIKIP